MEPGPVEVSLGSSSSDLKSSATLNVTGKTWQRASLAHKEEHYAGIARAVGGKARGSAAGTRPGHTPVSDDGRGSAGQDDDRAAARGRGDRLCARGRRARLSSLRSRFAGHRAREHRPGGRALIRCDAADAAGLGLRPQLRRAGPPTCLPDTGWSWPKTGEGDDVVSRSGAAGDSPRLRERGIRAATRAVPGRGGYAASQADRRPERLCTGTRVRAEHDADRYYQHPAAERPADAARSVRADATSDKGGARAAGHGGPGRGRRIHAPNAADRKGGPRALNGARTGGGALCCRPDDRGVARGVPRPARCPRLYREDREEPAGTPARFLAGGENRASWASWASGASGASGRRGCGTGTSAARAPGAVRGQRVDRQ